MSPLDTIKNLLGKRKRDVNDDPQEQGTATRIKTNTGRACILAPRRRSSPPGTFPGTEGEYSPREAEVVPENLKQSTIIEVKRADPKAKSAHSLGSDFLVTAVEESITPATTPAKDIATIKGVLTSHITQSDTEDSTVSSGTQTLKTLRRRRKNTQAHSDGGDAVLRKTKGHAAVHKYPSTPSPSTTRSFKDLLEDPSSPLAKAIYATKKAHARRKEVEEEIARLQKTSNNVFSKHQSRKQEVVVPETQAAPEEPIEAPAPSNNEPSTEPVAERATETVPEPANEPVTAMSSEVEDSSSLARSSSSVLAQHSPPSANESSDYSADSYTSTTSSHFSSSNSSSSSLASSKTSASTEISAHLSAQTEALSRTLEQVSALTTMQHIKTQQLITQSSTSTPYTPQQPQLLIDPAAFEQALERAIERKVDERYGAKLGELKDSRAPQEQQLSAFQRYTWPAKDYFDPRSGLRKNRVVLSVERSRSILEAHEVQYRYRLEDCPFQKLLGHQRLAKQEASFYPSMKNSVFGIPKEEYPTGCTAPFDSQSGKLLTWQQCNSQDRTPKPSLFDRPTSAMPDGWAGLSASVSARQGSVPMDGVEDTGAAAVDQTWKPDQNIRFSLPSPMEVAQPANLSPVNYFQQAQAPVCPPINPARQAALLANLDEIIRHGERNSSRHGSGGSSNLHQTSNPFQTSNSFQTSSPRQASNPFQTSHSQLPSHPQQSIHSHQPNPPISQQNAYMKGIEEILAWSARNARRTPFGNDQVPSANKRGDFGSLMGGGFESAGSFDQSAPELQNSSMGQQQQQQASPEKAPLGEYEDEML